MPSPHLRAQLQSAIAVANPVRLPDPEEIEKLKAEWRREQRAQEQEHNQRRAELVALRSQLHAAQQNLDVENRGRRMDAAQAAIRIKTLEAQLEAALGTASGGAATRIAKRNFWLRWSAVCASAALVGAVILICVPMLTRDRNVVVAPPPAPTATPVRVTPGQPAGAPQAFTGSLFRLSEALSRIPEEPESILKAVRAKNGKTCSFQWNMGQPALVYSGRAPGLSLSSSLDQCAQAVERYRSP